MQRTSLSFKSWFVDLEDAGCSWRGFGIWILIWIWSLVFGAPMIWILALYLDFEGQRTYMSFKSSFGALEDSGASWPGFVLLILIWIWSLAFDTNMFQNLAFYRDFEGCKEYPCPLSPHWGFECCWRFLTWVWHHELDLDMVTGLWYNHDPNFVSLPWFWSAKNIHVL